MNKLKNKLKNKHLKILFGVIICLFSILGLINYSYVSSDVTYAFVFLFGNLYFLIFAILIFLGICLIIQNEKFKKVKWNFIFTGLILLFFGILVAINIPLINDKSLTLNNFSSYFLDTIKFTNGSVNVFNFDLGGGYIGISLGCLFNTIFTSNIGTIIICALLMFLSLFFLLYKPIKLLIIFFVNNNKKEKTEKIELKDNKIVEKTDFNNDETNETSSSVNIENSSDLNLNEVEAKSNDIETQTSIPNYNNDYGSHQIYEDESISPLSLENEFKKQNEGEITLSSFPSDAFEDKNLTKNQPINSNLSLNKNNVSNSNDDFKTKYDSVFNLKEHENEFKKEELNNANLNNNIDNDVTLDQNNESVSVNIDSTNNFINEELNIQKNTINESINTKQQDEKDDYKKNDENNKNENITDQNVLKEEKKTNEYINIFKSNENNQNTTPNNNFTNDTNFKTENNEYVDPYKDFKPIDPNKVLKDVVIDNNELQENIELAEQIKEKINEKFSQLNIKAKAVSYTIGPSVTRYDIAPDANVSIGSLDRYLDDISMSLAGRKVRFEKIVFGKTTSSFEIPNSKSTVVPFKEIFEAMPKIDKRSLILPFGKDINGDFVFGDLVKFPHLLVCGQTGSGKSVLIHSFLVALMMRYSPKELKFIFVDPKRVELGQYKDSPHLLCPILKDMQYAKQLLDKLIQEMDHRYILFEEVGVRDIFDYNEYMETINGETIPYIVLVIDEFADLIETDRTIQSDVVRLASKARACGISMIIATQRPSADVISGLIKSNIPARVALSVKDSINSKIILDEVGAESLLGHGDMLISSMEMSRNGLLRVQGSFISTAEIRNVVQELKLKYPVIYDENFLNLVEKAENMQTSENVRYGEENTTPRKEQSDPLYEDVKELAFSRDFMSINYIIRSFGVGFNRAGKLFSMLIKEGIVEDNGSNTKASKVLVHSQEELNDKISGEI